MGGVGPGGGVDLVGFLVGEVVGVAVGILVGHSCVLHVRYRLSGHSSPPCFGETMTTILRCCDPPPQDREQADHGFHSKVQWMGQGCVLQFCDSVRSGHAAPPFVTAVVIERVLVMIPPPQGAEQEVNPVHGDTVQSTGQACTLHSAV